MAGVRVPSMVSSDLDIYIYIYVCIYIYTHTDKYRYRYTYIDTHRYTYMYEARTMAGVRVPSMASIGLEFRRTLCPGPLARGPARAAVRNTAGGTAAGGDTGGGIHPREDTGGGRAQSGAGADWARVNPSLG